MDRNVLQMVVVVLVLFLSVNPANPQTADELFTTGHFEKAEEAYRQVLQADPDNLSALIRMGESATYSNKLKLAEEWLTKAFAIAPDNRKVNILLGETFYRKDDFTKAAMYFRAAGMVPRADKLELFKGLIPNRISGERDSTTIKFETLDPLPVVKARINRGKEILLLLDTGGPDLILDTDFAREMNISIAEGASGVFAGGRTAGVGNGKIDQLVLGDFTVHHVPIGSMPLRNRVKMPKPIDGILGTVLLYHFIPTIDYIHGSLVLRKRTEDHFRKVRKDALQKNAIAFPFWMAGDHFLLAHGMINDKGPYFFHMDTGGAGLGFGGERKYLEGAGVDLTAKPVQMMGAGGPVDVIPVNIERISLGGAVEKDVRGNCLEQQPLSRMLGLEVAGTISHEFFKLYSVTFDFSEMIAYLEK